jgi:adenine-specific DNA-methyltransferase
MAKKKTKNNSGSTKTVVTLTHAEASRKNIPTAELQSVMHSADASPVRVAYERRNRDLDPQLVWRGKDEQDWSDLVVQAPPLFIQEKVHPKVLIDDLLREAQAARIVREMKDRTETGGIGPQIDLFADFNGLPDDNARTEFYQHDAHWANRLILGDSLQVMASLAEREGLRGQVQCIYIDPPYGIKFNSNFQWSTTSRDVKDTAEHITREPEQVKAFRDTWRDGIHSYLQYLRDRLTAARDLLSPTGSVFVQIGDENLHRVRDLTDEVFGDHNFAALLTIQKAGSTFARYLGGVADYVLWYARDIDSLKYRAMYADRGLTDEDSGRFTLAQTDVGQRIPSRQLSAPSPAVLVAPDPLQSASAGREKGEGAASWFPVTLQGKTFRPTMQSRWKTNEEGMARLLKADRVILQRESIRYARFFRDFPVSVLSNIWTDLAGATDKVYVVQTSTKIVERCILMTTDPGDLVLDPTCGSGTTAYVAEQWGRRWITIDTSRVALALARARIMGARYPYYLLADSREGQLKEAEVTRSEPSSAAVHNSLRQGFVYERVPHITLKSIANNAEIDVIWEKYQARLEPLREALNKTLGKKWEEWEIPREAGTPWPNRASKTFYDLKKARHDKGTESGVVAHLLQQLNREMKRHYTLDDLPPKPVDPWPKEAEKLHGEWWEQRVARQKEIDASIAAKAEFEFLFDKPYEDKKKVRVAGPFTVESLSPHRTLTVGADDQLIDPAAAPKQDAQAADFAQMILEHLKLAGVQQAHKEDRISFTSLAPWPGHFICAEGRYAEADGTEKRAGIFIGPEFGTVARQDLVMAAREAGDGGFDVVIACAFSYEAHASEFDRLGRIPVLKARMNAELHMGGELKNTGKGNLFVIFGEPDIDILGPADAPETANVKDFEMIRVRINGVDVFHPQTGEVRSDGPDGIACWFIDTDYNGESFFVRQAYFLGASDPYKALKTTLKAEINEEAWATLKSDTSREFRKPKSGQIAVKVINHLGDEVMKVFGVE